MPRTARESATILPGPRPPRAIGFPHVKGDEQLANTRAQGTPATRLVYAA